VWDKVKIEVDKTWHELVTAGKPKDINKKIHPVETEEGNKEYTGSVEIMLIDESEHLTAWERMQRRLEESPIIQGMCVTQHLSSRCFKKSHDSSITILHSLPNRYNDERTHCV
jgi:hypothetical protein